MSLNKASLVSANSRYVSYCLFSRTFLLTTILKHEVDFVYFLDDGPCGAQQYVCKNGKCIDLTARCDGKNDCLDDEQDCGTFRNTVKPIFNGHLSNSHKSSPRIHCKLDLH